MHLVGWSLYGFKCDEQSVRLSPLCFLSFSPYRVPYFSYTHWYICSVFP
jgi:hypothetical protein